MLRNEATYSTRNFSLFRDYRVLNKISYRVFKFALAQVCKLTSHQADNETCLGFVLNCTDRAQSLISNNAHADKLQRLPKSVALRLKEDDKWVDLRNLSKQRSAKIGQRWHFFNWAGERPFESLERLTASPVGLRSLGETMLAKSLMFHFKSRWIFVRK